MLEFIEKLKLIVVTYAKLTHNYFMKMMTNTTFLFTSFIAESNKTHAEKLKAQVFSSFQTFNSLREVFLLRLPRTSEIEFVQGRQSEQLRSAFTLRKLQVCSLTQKKTIYVVREVFESD